MAGYMGELDNLLGLLGAGLDPMAGLQQFDALKSQRQEQMMARRQAQAEAQRALLGELGQMALAEAGEGTSLDDLLSQLSAASAFQGSPMSPQQLTGIPQLGQGLESLYHLEGNPESPSFGQSRINPSIPAEDIAGLMKDATDAAMNGIPRAQAKNTLLAKAQTLYHPNLFASLAPQIAKLVDDAYVGGP